MFNVEKEVTKIIKFIKDYWQKYNLGGIILGLSGGKDSAVVSAIFTKALGKNKVVGVTMPCHTIESAKKDAKIISDYYGFELINFDLTKIFDTFKKEVNNLGNFKLEEVKNSDLNLKPRLRMATLYYLAALYSQIRHQTYLVAGTSNKCELYVGYFTKGGDSVYDIAVLADYTVDEVIKIGEYLKVPKKILYKVPNDDLSNMTDEEKLGVTYKEIASYMQNKNIICNESRKKIELLHRQNLHKFINNFYKRDDK